MNRKLGKNIMKAKLLLISSLILLSACSEPNGDLQTWMSQTKAEAKAKVKSIEPLPPVEPVRYSSPVIDRLNAFTRSRMTVADKNSDDVNANRIKEILEEYNLEDLLYVGYVGEKKNLSALIRTKTDDFIYTVKPGNHLGRNNGRITMIEDCKITIKEPAEKDAITTGSEEEQIRYLELEDSGCSSNNAQGNS